MEKPLTYFQVYTDFFDGRKARKVRKETNLTEDQFIALLIRFWNLTARQRADGIYVKDDWGWVCEKIGWLGDCELLYKAMLEAGAPDKKGFIEPLENGTDGFRVHDWTESQSCLLKDRLRKRGEPGERNPGQYPEERNSGDNPGERNPEKIDSRKFQEVPGSSPPPRRGEARRNVTRRQATSAREDGEIVHNPDEIVDNPANAAAVAAAISQSLSLPSPPAAADPTITDAAFAKRKKTFRSFDPIYGAHFQAWAIRFGRDVNTIFNDVADLDQQIVDGNLTAPKLDHIKNIGALLASRYKARP